LVCDVGLGLTHSITDALSWMLDVGIVSDGESLADS